MPKRNKRVRDEIFHLGLSCQKKNRKNDNLAETEVSSDEILNFFSLRSGINSE